MRWGIRGIKRIDLEAHGGGVGRRDRSLEGGIRGIKRIDLEAHGDGVGRRDRSLKGERGSRGEEGDSEGLGSRGR